MTGLYVYRVAQPGAEIVSAAPRQFATAVRDGSSRRNESIDEVSAALSFVVRAIFSAAIALNQ
jgi:hypothetical protein